MPDWGKFVRARLPEERRATPLDHEVVQELADYLEDACEARREQPNGREKQIPACGRQASPAKAAGIRDKVVAVNSITRAGTSEGIAVVDAEVNNWPRLARKIEEARGGTMVKQRTLTMWLPGLMSATGAFLLLCASQKIGAQPRILQLTPRISAMIYAGWLLVLPAFGAVAAWWSRRSGGSIANRILAALFPVASMIAIYLVILSSAILTDHGLGVPNLLKSFMGALIGGVLIPAAALLLGSLPYLRRGTERAEGATNDLTAKTT